MNKLSKADEQQAMLALETAIQHANTGMDPSAAIVKAAQDAQLEAPMVQRLVEAFNVSKTLHYFKKAAGEEKATTFPIASPEAIVAELFPPDPDTPQKEAAAAVHPAHADFTEFLMAKEAEDAQAIELPPMVDTPPEAYERDPAYFAKKAIDERGRLVALHKQAEKAAREVYWRMLETIDKAAAYFKRIDPGEPFDLVEKRAYATYGPNAKNLMDLIVEKGGLGDRRIGVKRAAAEDLGAQQMAFDPGVEPYNYVGDAMLFAREVARISKEAGAIADTVDEHAITNVHFLPERDVMDSIERQLSKRAKFTKAERERARKLGWPEEHLDDIEEIEGENIDKLRKTLKGPVKKAESRDMPHFTGQNRPEKVKDIYRALKRDRPRMPATLKARIAAKQGKKGKQKVGPPYKAPLSV